MIHITNLSRITPLYSKVIDRFKAHSKKYLAIQQDIFYEKESLAYFFETEQHCVEVLNPSIDIKLAKIDNLPDDIISEYEYSYFILFAVTLGKPADELIASYLSNNKFYQGYLIDSWLAECVETINQHTDNIADKFFGSNTRSRRFSPGFGKVDIKINTDLDNRFQFANIKVNHKTGILTPTKSTICLIGYNQKIHKERWVSFYEDLKNLFRK